MKMNKLLLILPFLLTIGFSQIYTIYNGEPGQLVQEQSEYPVIIINHKHSAKTLITLYSNVDYVDVEYTWNKKCNNCNVHTFLDLFKVKGIPTNTIHLRFKEGSGNKLFIQSKDLSKTQLMVNCDTYKAGPFTYNHRFEINDNSVIHDGQTYNHNGTIQIVVITEDYTIFSLLKIN